MAVVDFVRDEAFERIPGGPRGRLGESGGFEGWRADGLLDEGDPSRVGGSGGVGWVCMTLYWGCVQS
jgi:hypothetical protein